MHAFGISRELCMEFLRKQCVIANLSTGKCVNGDGHFLFIKIYFRSGKNATR